MGLDWWTLKFIWDRDDKCDIDSAASGGGQCLAHTKVFWQYIRAELTFHLPSVAEENDKHLESAVIHELTHILVNEMRWVDAHTSEGDDLHHNIDHEERVVTTLTQAFEWVRSEGQSEGKKLAAVKVKRKK